MKRLLRERPWLLIVVAFLALIGAWAALITVASRHPLEPVPVAPVQRP